MPIPTLYGNAVRNWIGLRPEERWWLYTITAAATGRPEHADIGWRKALRFALTENPLADPMEGPIMRPNAGHLAEVQGEKPRTKPRFPGFEDDVSPLRTTWRDEYSSRGSEVEPMIQPFAWQDAPSLIERLLPGAEDLRRSAEGTERQVQVRRSPLWVPTGKVANLDPGESLRSGCPAAGDRGF